eukprot:g1363.t1
MSYSFLPSSANLQRLLQSSDLSKQRVLGALLASEQQRGSDFSHGSHGMQSSPEVIDLQLLETLVATCILKRLSFPVYRRCFQEGKNSFASSSEKNEQIVLGTGLKTQGEKQLSDPALFVNHNNIQSSLGHCELQVFANETTKVLDGSSTTNHSTSTTSSLLPVIPLLRNPTQTALLAYTFLQNCLFQSSLQNHGKPASILDILFSDKQTTTSIANTSSGLPTKHYLCSTNRQRTLVWYGLLVYCMQRDISHYPRSIRTFQEKNFDGSTSHHYKGGHENNQSHHQSNINNNTIIASDGLNNYGGHDDTGSSPFGGSNNNTMSSSQSPLLASNQLQFEIPIRVFALLETWSAELCLLFYFLLTFKKKGVSQNCLLHLIGRTREEALADDGRGGGLNVASDYDEEGANSDPDDSDSEGGDLDSFVDNGDILDDNHFQNDECQKKTKKKLDGIASNVSRKTTMTMNNENNAKNVKKGASSVVDRPTSSSTIKLETRQFPIHTDGSSDRIRCAAIQGITKSSLRAWIILMTPSKSFPSAGFLPSWINNININININIKPSSPVNHTTTRQRRGEDHCSNNCQCSSSSACCSWTELYPEFYSVLYLLGKKYGVYKLKSWEAKRRKEERRRRRRRQGEEGGQDNNSAGVTNDDKNQREEEKGNTTDIVGKGEGTNATLTMDISHDGSHKGSEGESQRKTVKKDTDPLSLFLGDRIANVPPSIVHRQRYLAGLTIAKDRYEGSSGEGSSAEGSQRGGSSGDDKEEGGNQKGLTTDTRSSSSSSRSHQPEIISSSQTSFGSEYSRTLMKKMIIRLWTRIFPATLDENANVALVALQAVKDLLFIAFKKEKKTTTSTNPNSYLWNPLLTHLRQFLEQKMELLFSRIGHLRDTQSGYFDSGFGCLAFIIAQLPFLFNVQTSSSCHNNNFKDHLSSPSSSLFVHSLKSTLTMHYKGSHYETNCCNLMARWYHTWLKPLLIVQKGHGRKGHYNNKLSFSLLTRGLWSVQDVKSYFKSLLLHAQGTDMTTSDQGTDTTTSEHGATSKNNSTSSLQNYVHVQLQINFQEMNHLIYTTSLHIVNTILPPHTSKNFGSFASSSPTNEILLFQTIQDFLLPVMGEEKSPGQPMVSKLDQLEILVDIACQLERTGSVGGRKASFLISQQVSQQNTKSSLSPSHLASTNVYYRSHSSGPIQNSKSSDCGEVDMLEKLWTLILDKLVLDIEGMTRRNCMKTTIEEEERLLTARIEKLWSMITPFQSEDTPINLREKLVWYLLNLVQEKWSVLPKNKESLDQEDPDSMRRNKDSVNKIFEQSSFRMEVFLWTVLKSNKWILEDIFNKFSKYQAGVLYTGSSSSSFSSSSPVEMREEGESQTKLELEWNGNIFYIAALYLDIFSNVTAKVMLHSQEQERSRSHGVESNGTDEVESNGTDEVESNGTDEVESNGTDEVESNGTDEVESNGTDEVESKRSHAKEIVEFLRPYAIVRVRDMFSSSRSTLAVREEREREAKGEQTLLVKHSQSFLNFFLRLFRIFSNVYPIIYPASLVQWLHQDLRKARTETPKSSSFSMQEESEIDGLELQEDAVEHINEIMVTVHRFCSQFGIRTKDSSVPTSLMISVYKLALRLAKSIEQLATYMKSGKETRLFATGHNHFPFHSITFFSFPANKPLSPIEWEKSFMFRRKFFAYAKVKANNPIQVFGETQSESDTVLHLRNTSERYQNGKKWSEFWSAFCVAKDPGLTFVTPFLTSFCLYTSLASSGEKFVIRFLIVNDVANDNVNMNVNAYGPNPPNPMNKHVSSPVSIRIEMACNDEQVVQAFGDRKCFLKECISAALQDDVIVMKIVESNFQ